MWICDIAREITEGPTRSKGRGRSVATPLFVNGWYGAITGRLAEDLSITRERWTPLSNGGR
jgi:hypothetical protein